MKNLKIILLLMFLTTMSYSDASVMKIDHEYFKYVGEGEKCVRNYDLKKIQSKVFIYFETKGIVIQDEGLLGKDAVFITDGKKPGFVFGKTEKSCKTALIIITSITQNAKK